jgi:hypothetical protein
MEGSSMQLTFLGKTSEGGDSPTLYATDRDSYIVQGYVVTDHELLEKLDPPEGQTVVEVNAQLFRHLAKDGVTGTVTSCVPPIVHVGENSNYVVQGVRLVDQDARQQLALPEHEDAVEIPKAAIRALLETRACD